MLGYFQATPEAARDRCARNGDGQCWLCVRLVCRGTSGRLGTRTANGPGDARIGVKVASGPGGLGGPGRALRGRRGGTLTFFAAREAQAASGSALRLSSLELRLYGLRFSFKSVYRVWGSWFRVQDSASKVSG